jgi:diaminohydroxyphosphoribosylaminopyrimidine deaminase/5-amino-6-(5-phosphoribosylamino)uracil reductase
MDEQISTHLSTEEAMRMALAEAYKGAPYVSPNPLVGCVILDSEGHFLKSGYHQIYGGLHAEANALLGLNNDQLEGAHVIVTLEPCAHEGKTPSCAKTLAALPIKKVTYGLIDPNPLVAGKGLKILREAGKEVEAFQGLRDELEEVCEAFLMNQRHNKIFVALKVATSLDGQMALRSGQSQWITGSVAREHAHYLRSCYDAVLVGAGTVLKDNPSLNIRHPRVSKENKVVVLDPEGLTLANFAASNLAKTHLPENIFICVEEKKSVKEASGGPRILKIKSGSGTLSASFVMDHLLAQLWEQGLRSVYVEGGAHTFSGFIKSGWAHRLYIYVAPHLMGAGGGLAWTQGLSIQEMKDRLTLHQLRSEKMGEDWLLTARFPDESPGF